MASATIYVMKGNYGTSSLSKGLPWPYHHSDINRFYRDDLIKQGGIRKER